MSLTSIYTFRNPTPLRSIVLGDPISLPRHLISCGKIAHNVPANGEVALKINAGLLVVGRVREG